MKEFIVEKVGQNLYCAVSESHFNYYPNYSTPLLYLEEVETSYYHMWPALYSSFTHGYYSRNIHLKIVDLQYATKRVV